MRFRYEEHEVKEWQKYFFKLWHATHPAPCATDMYCMYMYIVTLKKKKKEPDSYLQTRMS